MNIALIGYRGSGKTTIGKKLARKLKMKFIDSDRAIEKNTGKSISAIFRKEGEKKFREYEKKAIAQIAKLDNYVIACGGGAVLDIASMRLLKKNSITFYMEAGIDTIYRRTRKSNRPRLTGIKSLKDEIGVMLKKRIPLYGKYADFAVNAENNPAKVLNEITEKIRWAIR